jgi:hypothetical protein
MASTAGAIRTALVDAGLDGVSERIYRDIAPPEIQYPYITISDEITNQPVLLGDKKVLARLKQLRVNLWQLRTEEDVTLVDDVVEALDSSVITANKTVFRVRVFDVQRIFESQDDIILHVVTLNVTQKAQ